MAALPRLVDLWLLAGDIARHSPRTIDNRRLRLGQFVWFLSHRALTHCGPHELRAFLYYLTHSHEETGGRWGNPCLTKPTKPGTVHSHHTTLKTFFNWLVAEGEITVSPLARIPPPLDRPDQIEPLTPEQVRALLTAARRPGRTAGTGKGNRRPPEYRNPSCYPTRLKASTASRIFNSKPRGLTA